MYRFFIIILFSGIFVLAQDTTRSEAFKNTDFFKPPIFKAKYPSYSLLAAYLLVKEANRGDPFAQHELGLRYLIGQGFSADTVKAVYWIRRAVDQNLPSARFNYGILLYNGIGVPWNPYDAFINFKNAAQAGLPEAQFAYGLLLTDNLTVNRNLNEAYKYVSKSAKAGFKPAIEALPQFKQLNLVSVADSNQNDKAIILNDETAKIINPNWDLDFFDFDSTSSEQNDEINIQELLNKNSRELMKKFGLDDLTDVKSLQDTSGIGIVKYAADNGSPEALLVIAKGYETGILFEKNIIKSAANYIRAYRLGSFKAGENLYRLLQEESFTNIIKEKIKQGDAEAMFVWAGITAMGFGNQVTEKQALEFLKTAVDKKHVPSMIELGILYSAGTLVEKSRSKAIDYWQMAKNLGSREAEVRIAFAELVEGSDKIDMLSQITILRNSANEGSVLAQAFLGYCYEKGIGIRENKAIAVRLFRHAAQRGNQAAMNSLKRLYDEIRPNDEQFQIYVED